MEFSIEVNNRKIQARKGDTILETLTQNGIKIPRLCSVKNLSPTGACRICVVEVEGMKNLVASCSYPVSEGMVIHTHSPRVLKARKVLVELLLSNHPDDCLYCERNGNCELQDLSYELNVRERRITGVKSKLKLDLSDPCIVRDSSKCILCGRCVRVCDEIQSVSTFEFINRGSKTRIGTSMNRDLNFSNCIGCGQCILTCPTKALHEQSSLDRLQTELYNNKQQKVIQLDPAIMASIGEEFGVKPGKEIEGKLVASLRKIGFNYVFSTSFAADMVLMECAAELKQRMETKENLPLISSFCPAWVKYAEQFYPELLPHLSKVKSPALMLGSITKSYFANTIGVKQADILSVVATPCLARKFESQRIEMTRNGISDVDIVLTTRELAHLIRIYGIDLQNIEALLPDLPFRTSSSSGKLYANAGGFTEGVLRTLYYQTTGKEIPTTKIGELRSISGIKEYEQKIGKEQVKVVVSNGLTNINSLAKAIREGKLDAHFVEIVACQGGCVNGGGQPIGLSVKDKKMHAKSIYDIDDTEIMKAAHKNALLKDVYDKFPEVVGKKNVDILLYTRYTKRDVLR